ncbi:hypothetical protein JCGZ_11814 [Jatropha curcas]|uniref:F-box domain-containing protein n=1 Tax=Jatropha curcas TaxID=180498 RepID=A0A067K8T8_JATCU|nr:hypothetical protein JCGZ_11814 [Jatropha curcas]
MDTVILTADIISNLTKNVIKNILAHLPLQEAVRTSVLSKKWRHNWENIPLIFDNTFQNHIKAKPATRNELFVIIYQVLLLRRCPVTKFILSLSRLKNCPQIDHTIHFLSRNGVQELTLCIKNDTPLLIKASIEGDGNVPDVKEGYGIDMVEVFSCVPRLEYLFIDYYLLEIMAAGNVPDNLPTSFNSLKTLVFHGQITDSMDDVEEFLEVQKHSNFLLHQLQVVRMTSFGGTEREMEFVKLLLAK